MVRVIRPARGFLPHPGRNDLEGVQNVLQGSGERGGVLSLRNSGLCGLYQLRQTLRVLTGRHCTPLPRPHAVFGSGFLLTAQRPEEGDALEAWAGLFLVDTPAPQTPQTEVWTGMFLIPYGSSSKVQGSATIAITSGVTATPALDIGALATIDIASAFSAIPALKVSTTTIVPIKQRIIQQLSLTQGVI